MTGIEDDEYEIPLRDQRYFGAGLKRKRVQFVPSSTTLTSTSNLPAPVSSTAASQYLEIVLGNRKTFKDPAESANAAEESTPEDGAEASSDPDTNEPAVKSEEVPDVGRATALCDICNRPVANVASAVAHESSLTHQICLQHSHPPSHLDRTRKGLQVLSTQGWDPDSRMGLGSTGSGILYPIKAKENPQRVGLGVKAEDLTKASVKEKPVKLDAGKVRKMEAEKRKKGQSLRDAFYRSEDVERYLGGGEEDPGGDGTKRLKSRGLR